ILHARTSAGLDVNSKRLAIAFRFLSQQRLDFVGCVLGHAQDRLGWWYIIHETYEQKLTEALDRVKPATSGYCGSGSECQPSASGLTRTAIGYPTLKWSITTTRKFRYIRRNLYW